MASADPKRQTRSTGDLLDPDNDFPAISKFKDPKKLPLCSDIIGVLRHLLEDPKSMITTSQALHEVKKMVYSKWYHDTVYCITPVAILKCIEKEWNIFKEGKKRIRSGRLTGKAVDQYKQMRDRSHKLFDVAASTTERLKQCEAEFGVKMSQNEISYLDDQRNDRKMECDKGVDIVWYTAMMKRQRQHELSEEYKKEMEKAFRCVDIDEIINVLGDEGELSADSEANENVDEVYLQPSIPEQPSETAIPDSTEPSAKRKHFSDIGSSQECSDILPAQMRHIRVSERIIQDDIYETLADLKGLGLSMSEASSALIKVSNNLFGRHWKMLEEEESSFDLNTLPHPRNMRYVDELIEAKSLACISKEIEEASQAGRMITHATDSTTKKGLVNLLLQAFI